MKTRVVSMEKLKKIGLREVDLQIEKNVILVKPYVSANYATDKNYYLGHKAGKHAIKDTSNIKSGVSNAYGA